MTALLLALALGQAQDEPPRPAIAHFVGVLRPGPAREGPRYELHAGTRVYVLAFDPTAGDQAAAAKLVGRRVEVSARGVYAIGDLDVLLVIWLEAAAPK